MPLGFHVLAKRTVETWQERGNPIPSHGTNVAVTSDLNLWLKLCPQAMARCLKRSEGDLHVRGH